MSKKNEAKSGKFKSIAIRTIIGGLTALFAAVATEYNGYRFLDRGSGENILCDVDPNCRYMTEGEIQIAREVFGDQINYNHVKIFDRPWLGIPFAFEFRDFKMSLADKAPEQAQQDSSEVRKDSTACPPDSADEISYIFALGQLWKIERSVYSVNNVGRSPNGNIYFSDNAYRDDFSQGTQQDKIYFIHELAHVFQDHAGHNLVLRAFKDSRQSNYNNLYDYELDKVEDFADLNLEQQAEFIENYYDVLVKYKNTQTATLREELEKYLEILAPYIIAAHEKQVALTLNKKLPDPAMLASIVPMAQESIKPAVQPASTPVLKPNPLPLQIAPVTKPACPAPGS